VPRRGRCLIPQVCLGFAASLVLLVLTAVPVPARSHGGSIAGTVSDRTGAALSDVTVEVSGHGPAFTLKTGADGRYGFLDLPPAEYLLTAFKPGFRPARRDGLRVGLGEAVSVAVVLDLEGAGQSVEVRASSRQDRSSSTFTHEDLTRIPTPRDAAALLASTPGVVADRINVGGSDSHQWSQFVFRGSRMLDAAWTIDGVVVTDRQTGSPPGFYDVEAFEQIQFASVAGDITRPGSGLAVDMVVRSGTSVLRGTGRGYFSGAGLEASNVAGEQGRAPASVTPAPADHTQQIAEYGADLGGPLIQGRAWFWASASRQDVRVVRRSGGDERAVLTPHNIKVNWQATSKDMLTGLWLDHGIQRFGVNPSAFRAPLDARQNQSSFYPDNPFHGLWKIEDRRIVRPTLFVTARYAYYGTGYQNISIGAGQAGISARLGETTGATSSTRSLRPQHTVALDGTYFRDIRRTSHEIRFGGSWQQNDMVNWTRWPGDGVVAFDLSAADQRARIYREQLGRNRLRLASAYVSDTMSASRATLDVGLRFDLQRAWGLASSPPGNPSFPDLVPGIVFPGDQSASSWANLSPRAAVTWALDAPRRAVLRGSVGRYASPLVMGVAAQTNPANTMAWIEYPWEDRNGDRLAQPGEVRVDQPYLAFDGFNPVDPGAPVSLTARDPDMRWRTTAAASVSIEYRFAPALSATFGYDYARHAHWPYQRWQGLDADDYSVVRVLSGTLPGGATWSTPVYAPDPEEIGANGGGKIISSYDTYHSTYHGLQASLVKLLSRRWMMSATAAWNDSRGFYAGPRPVNSFGNPTRLDGATGTGPLSSPVDPLVHGGQVAPATLATGGGGSIFLSARWQVALNGAYLFPWGLEVAGNLLGRQGAPSPYVIPQRLGLDGSRNVLVTPAVDSVRLDDVWNLDLRVARRFHYQKLSLQAIGDVFNVLNDDAALLRERNLLSPNFGRVNRSVSPRILRLGLRMSF
jgi:hypothetical protein